MDNQNEKSVENQALFYWNSHDDPWDNERWTPFHYSAQEILEEGYQKFLKGDSNQTVAIGNYLIDFEIGVQINKFDNSKVRQIIRSNPEDIKNAYNFIRPIVMIRSKN